MQMPLVLAGPERCKPLHLEIRNNEIGFINATILAFLFKKIITGMGCDIFLRIGFDSLRPNTEWFGRIQHLKDEIVIEEIQKIFYGTQNQI